MQVKALFEEVLQGDLDPAIAFKVQKMYKATDKAMAVCKYSRVLMMFFLRLSMRKRRGEVRKMLLGNARVMG